MRKHFLLLFLMALLPLASFAVTDVDISTKVVAITLETSSPVYNNQVQTPTITKVVVDGVEYTSELTQFFTPKYYKKNASNNWIEQNADQIQDAGEYAVAIVANGATDAERELKYTAGKESPAANRATYTILKKDLHVTLANGTKQYGGTDPTTLGVTPTDLPSGWTTPDFVFAALPRTAGEGVSSTGYAYTFTLDDNAQDDITSVNYNVIITNQPKLIVTKKAITLDYSGTMPSKVYGVATPNDGLNAEFLTGIKSVANYSLHTGSTLEGGENLSDVLAGITANGKVTTAFNYVDDTESANADKDGNALTSPKAHKLTISIDESVAGNYEFTVSQVDLKVKQAKLFTGENAPFTFSKAETSNLTYNGAEQSVTKTLVYTANNTYLLREGTTPATPAQVNVTYKYKPTADAGETAADNKTAGIYVAYVAPVANGNFYIESVNPIRVEAFDYTIDKKPLYVYVTAGDITKVYQGSAYTLPVSDAITFQGLTTADATDATITAAKAAVVAKRAVVDNSTNPATVTWETTVTNAGSYTIIPDVPAASALHTNYDVQAYESTFTVSPLAITIKPTNITVAYGTAIAGTYPADATAGTGNVTVTKVNNSDPAIKAADQALVLQAYNVVVADQTYAAGTPYIGAITLAKKALVSPADDAIIAMLDNFTINDEGTGDVTIGEGSYTIVAKDKNKTYGETYTWDIFDYLTPGLPSGTTPADVKFILVNKADAEETYSEYAGDVLPKNAGTYTIKVDAEHSNLTITNYGAPTLNDGELTIAPKALKAVLDDQTLMVGDTKAALAKSMVKFVEVPVAATPVEGVVGEDVIGFALDFNFGAVAGQITEDTYSAAEAEAYNKTLTGAIDYEAYTVGQTFTDAQVAEYNAVITPTVDNTTVIADGHITAIKNYNAGLTGAISGTTAAANGYSQITKKLTKDAIWVHGIKIAQDNTVANNANANYDIDWDGTAQLTVLVNTKLDLASNDNDLTNIQKVATANPTTKVSVTLDLNKRTVASPAAKWDAQKWNTLVLPFDIEVADLSRIFGYAIVNVLDKANTTGRKVAFKIEMGTIPANTPFTIKTAKKLIKETGDAAGTYVSETGIIDFGTQLVKAPTAEQIAGADAGNGCLFVPAYQTKTIDNTMPDLLFLMGNRDKWIYVQNATTKWNVVPFAAYMDLTNAGVSASEMIFTFQEADGSTTAIKAVDMDFVGSEKGYTVDGWYTLNGVKLQGAPTEKGVYINNGKKVVIK